MDNTLDTTPTRNYLSWYWNRYKPDFPSFTAFASAVGARPSSEWTLTKTQKRSRLTADNFVWITRDAAQSITANTSGDPRDLTPPRFPAQADRTPEAQAQNTRRFYQYAERRLAWRRGRAEGLKARQTMETQLALILDKLGAFLASKGFSEADTLNPAVLADHPKVQQARALITELIRRLNHPRGHRLAALAHSTRQRRQERKALNAHNRVHIPGRRGRPFSRYKTVKIPLADLQNPNTRDALLAQYPTLAPLLDTTLTPLDIARGYYTVTTNPHNASRRRYLTLTVPRTDEEIQALIATHARNSPTLTPTPGHFDENPGHTPQSIASTY